MFDKNYIERVSDGAKSFADQLAEEECDIPNAEECWHCGEVYDRDEAIRLGDRCPFCDGEVP